MFKSSRRWSEPSTLTCSLVAALGIACSEDAGVRQPMNGGSGGSGSAPVNPIPTGAGNGPIGLPKGMVGGIPGQAPQRTCEVCEDFPATPIVVEGTPPSAPSMFGDAPSGAGPCIAEPADGSLFPYNWLRPRIRWVGSSSVYEVRVKTARQRNELVVYTSKTEYYIPSSIWAGDETTKSQGLARNNYEEDITVTVRGVGSGASSVKFKTAAIDATGSLVYWANVQSQTEDQPMAGDKAGWLMGFAVGDEGVVEALRVLDVKTPSRTYAAEQKPIACIGCHTSTPDGDAVSFTGFWPWNGALASVTQADRGGLPTYVTPSGLAAIQQMWLGAWTFSRGQWADGNRIAVASYGANALGWPDGDQNKTNGDNLLWMNLAAAEPAAVPTQAWELRQMWAPAATGKALGILKRNGDTRAALMPDFSSSGTQLIYTSSSTSLDGRIGELNDTDIYAVPFNAGAGGDAAPLPGASEKGTAEYYPNYSADDQFVAFNRIANVMGIRNPMNDGFVNHLYYRPESEIWITATAAEVTAAPGETSSGKAVRLRANDPDACGGKKSPGVLNSWAKFSPRVNTVSGKTYYWLIFSSTRDTPMDQRAKVTDPRYKPVETLYSRLYMAPFTVEGGKISTYPAIYLWNQEETSNNLTPAWDDFKIPEVPPPMKPR
jgi:hypothetical protein